MNKKTIAKMAERFPMTRKTGAFLFILRLELGS